MDPWGAPAPATVGSAGPSPPPTVPAPAAPGPWGPAPPDPWGVASPTSPTSSDPWGGGPPPTIAPPPDPWGESSNRVNSVDPWGSSGETLLHWSHINFVGQQVGVNVSPAYCLSRLPLWTPPCTTPYKVQSSLQPCYVLFHVMMSHFLIYIHAFSLC